MNSTAEHLASASQAAAETFFALASNALTRQEDLSSLNLNLARTLLEEEIRNVQALHEAKDAQQYFALRLSQSQSLVEKLVAYTRSLYEITAQFQGAMTKVAEAHFVEINKNVSEALDSAAKHAPAGSDVAIAAVKSAIASASTAYENFSNANKQAAEIAEASFAATAPTKAAGNANKSRKAA